MTSIHCYELLIIILRWKILLDLYQIINLMNNTIKKVSSYILILLVLLTTTIAILEIWGIHLFDIKAIFWRLMQSLLVIFSSSAVLLFIFAVILKEKKEE